MISASEARSITPPSLPATIPPFALGRSHKWIWLGLAIVSLEIRTGFPVHAIAYADMDDALFLRLAGSLGTGRWLGAFDLFTLVKGMFYPLFILLSAAAGIPLKLAEHAVYLLACAYTAWVAARSGRRGWIGTAVFAALAFNPVFWDTDMSRVIREGLYIGLSVAVIGLLVGVLAPGQGQTRTARAGRITLAGLFGVTLGAFWLTREEGVWLLPAIAVIVAGATSGAAVDAWRRRGMADRPRGGFVAVGGSVLAAVMGYALVVGGVMALNQHFYGRAITVEVKSGPFERAYGALSRIEAEPWRRYVVFPRSARMLAYAVSPAARELQPTLDGDVGDRWRRVGCTESAAPATTDCTEILSSWFQWALRESVSRAGHYSSLPEAARFYDQLAQEINTACDRGSLPCGPPRASLAPPFRWQYLADAAHSALGLTRILVRSQFAAPVQPSVGPPRRIDIFDDVAGPVSRESRLTTEVIGWIDAPQQPSVSFLPKFGLQTRADLAVVPSEDDVGKLPGATRVEFRLSSDCPADQCAMVVAVPGREPLALTLQQMQQTPRTERSDIAVIVRFSAQTSSYQARSLRGILMARIARPIARLYQLAMPVLLVAGTLGLVLALARGGFAVLQSGLFLLGLAAAVATVSRIALLAYVDVTAIASVNLLYASPATPFVILWAVVGTVLLVLHGPKRSWAGRRTRAAGL